MHVVDDHAHSQTIPIVDRDVYLRSVDVRGAALVAVAHAMVGGDGNCLFVVVEERSVSGYVPSVRGVGSLLRQNLMLSNGHFPSTSSHCACSYCNQCTPVPTHVASCNLPLICGAVAPHPRGVPDATRRTIE